MLSKQTTGLVYVGSFIAGLGLMWGLGKGATAGPEVKPDTPSTVATPASVVKTTKPGAVKMELFVMSQCPYGVQVEEGLKDAVAKLGDDLDLQVDYIGEDNNGVLTSMHGDPEVVGNTAQLCAMKMSNKWFDFIECQNKNYREVGTNYGSCAAEVGIDPKALAACTTGAEGKALLAASFKRAKDRNATGSPTIYLAGKEYEGGRRPMEFMRAICDAYTGEKPQACHEIPEPAKVNVAILSDKRCGADCDTSRLEGAVRRAVQAPVITLLDYGDAKAKKMFDAAKPLNLPALFMDATLDADPEATAAFGQSLRIAGEHKVVEAGEWNPACADAGGCKTDACKSTSFCRPEVPNKLEVFVMSECPFGVKAMNAMKEVLANFDKNKAKLDFEIHYIGDKGPGGELTSMHGQGEVDEDVRMACAADAYAKDRKYMDYIWCRAENIRGDWKACTGEKTGIDASVIEGCFNGKGKDLVAKSFDVAAGLKIGASPTWLVNGKHKFSGVDPETIKVNVCAHNKLAGCDEKLSGNAPAPTGAAQQDAPGCGG